MQQPKKNQPLFLREDNIRYINSLEQWETSSVLTSTTTIMNPTVAIFLTLLVSYVKANTKELSPSDVLKHKVQELCIKETKATPEQAKILFNYKDLPKDATQNCFLECVYKKTGGIDGDGKYSVEGFNKLIDMKYKGKENTDAKKIAMDCATKVAPKEGEKCSMGRSIRECLTAATKENDFFTI